MFIIPYLLNTFFLICLVQYISIMLLMRVITSAGVTFNYFLLTFLEIFLILHRLICELLVNH